MEAEKTERKQRGRPFEKGRSGNPAGRPKGAMNRTTMALKAIMQDQAEAVLQVLIDQAMVGDVQACRAILERLVPVCRESPIDEGAVSLPELSAATLPAAVASVVQSVAEGSLAPSQGEKLVGMLQGFGRSVELQEIEQRIAALEGQGVRNE